MDNGKYGKYIFTEPKGDKRTEKEHDVPFLEFEGIKYWKDLAFGISVMPVLSPWLIENKIMKHDFDQILCFLGTDPSNINDFQAEVELCLGEEAEKHIINKSTAVYVPKGLAHCPLNFKIIRKPVVFIDITLTSEYTSRVFEGGKWGKLLKG